MNDIDTRLKDMEHNIQPRRALSADFASVVMGQIKEAKRPAPSLWAQLVSQMRRTTSLRHLSKPAAIAIVVAALGLMAGTGYAALKWLQPRSTLDKQSVVTLPNGNKRFWIHSDTCQGQDMEFAVDSYYEIRAGSTITPEELRKGIEASCEDDLLEHLFPEAMQTAKRFRDFKPYDKQYFFPWSQVLAIDDRGVTLTSKLNGASNPAVKLPFDKNARLYEKGQKVTREHIKPGDWVTVVGYTTALAKPFSTETMTDAEIAALSDSGFPKGLRIAGLIRRQYNPEQYMGVIGAMGYDWTRLVEDKKSPDGWKQLVPFDHDWEQYKKSYKD